MQEEDLTKFSADCGINEPQRSLFSNVGHVGLFTGVVESHAVVDEVMLLQFVARLLLQLILVKKFVLFLGPLSHLTPSEELPAGQ